MLINPVLDSNVTKEMRLPPLYGRQPHCYVVAPLLSV